MVAGDAVPQSIPTVGEYASAALSGFIDLQKSTGVRRESGLDSHTRLDAMRFLYCCLSLLDKFPVQTRSEFAATLPFTDLELRLLRQPRDEDDASKDEVCVRLYQWVHYGPMLVGESTVSAADFLRALIPHLDLWAERELAAKAIQRMLFL